MLAEAPTRRFLIVLLAVTLLRLLMAAAIPLTGDEAYYWAWTQHLALGYHDHPPMVAWVISASTHLLGTSTFTVRLPFVLIGSGIAWLSFVLGWQLTRSAVGAMWSGVLALIVPLFLLAGMVDFPDSPMLLAAAGFFVCAWRSVETGDMRWWLAAGACAGAAGLGKLTGLYLMPALFVFLLARRRDALRGPGPWLMVAAALLVLSPFIYWNVLNGFESLAYQYGSRLGSPQEHRKLYTPTYLLLSAAAVSPIMYVMLMWAIARAGLIGWRERNDALLYAFCMAAPLHVLFLLCSFITKIGLHWTAPGTLAAFAAFGAWMAAPAAPRGWATAGAALAALISGLVCFFALAPATLVRLASSGVQMAGINHGQPLKTSEILEVVGYPQAGAWMREHVSDSEFLITTNYTLSSVLWFYSGRPFHVIMGTRIGAQYDHWDDFPSLLGKDAVYVDTSPIETREDVWEKLHAAFESVTLEPPFTTYGRDGTEARTFYVARCRNFRADVFTRLQSIHR